MMTEVYAPKINRMNIISSLQNGFIAKETFFSQFSRGNHPGSTSTTTSLQQGQWPENRLSKWWPRRSADRAIRGEKSARLAFRFFPSAADHYQS